ncbi:aconitate hydratase AcnA [Candidatus Pantoea carbekii]|uniref:aconitate hydratase AcnA n=1 Tax=Candidatus Pantoea carbekii TaxID=1235990 RepID=UPI0006187485|nr:aconitate hydratase AcnA [Candidatus Pantoea carbekii]AKC32072.1 aconitate hydratase 1 AcnA [Candidatus Pantoea carbekii]
MSLILHEHSKDTLYCSGKQYHYYSLLKAAQHLGNIDRLPKSMKVLLENLLRWQDADSIQEEHIQSIVKWQKNAHIDCEIPYRPARILMQDFTGVPAIVDLASMRNAVKRLGGNIKKVNPILPVDLVIDHSISVDYFGNKYAFTKNVNLEMERNQERYIFLRWGQKTFDRFRVVPPGTGICHQVNLEYLAKIIWNQIQDGKTIVYPDTLVGTDSHTTMINALGVLGWGVGGIEAEAAMLGQPISILVPDIIGFKFIGTLSPGITATDLVLTVTQMLRKKGVVGKFVEFYGDGLENLSLADRATISNMAPEYGATCAFFPIDAITLKYLRLTGRDEEQIELVEIYAKKQGLWRNIGDEPIFTSTLTLNIKEVESCIAGPKRPQDRVLLSDVPSAFSLANKQKIKNLPNFYNIRYKCDQSKKDQLDHGAVVIAAITSCTNTSNPSVLITAGLLAKKAIKYGLRCKNWVKTSLAPGSKVVSTYLTITQLTPHLDKLGFNLVGYGCTTCIGNSGSLSRHIENTIKKRNLTVAAVLSGNRNFEGRIHPLVQTNWLASPPLVVAYALAGNIKINLQTDAIAKDRQGNDIFLKDLWPSREEISEVLEKITSDMFKKQYAKIFLGTSSWQKIQVSDFETYNWNKASTYIQPSPFFEKMEKTFHTEKKIKGARILAIYGDSVTTDHISPAGSIKANSPAGRYLLENGIEENDFNSYGSRRGNYEVMIRGTFANTRIRNEMISGIEGGYTRHFPSNEILSIYDAAMRYKTEGISLVIIAGKEYGSGSSRDWAAKGPRLQGVCIIIAESFERIHRSNLIGMGILPLEFLPGITRKTLCIEGDESIELCEFSQIKPNCKIKIILKRINGKCETLETQCRIDTKSELMYYQNGGILQYMIRNMLK